MKYNFIFFVLLRDYFNSSNLYKKSELPRNQFDSSRVRVKKEIEKFTVVCSCSPPNLEFGHFTLLFCRGRQIKVPKFKTHVQSDWPPPSLFKFLLTSMNFLTMRKRRDCALNMYIDAVEYFFLLIKMFREGRL